MRADPCICMHMCGYRMVVTIREESAPSKEEQVSWYRSARTKESRFFVSTVQSVESEKRHKHRTQISFSWQDIGTKRDEDWVSGI